MRTSVSSHQVPTSLHLCPHSLRLCGDVREHGSHASLPLEGHYPGNNFLHYHSVIITHLDLRTSKYAVNSPIKKKSPS